MSKPLALTLFTPEELAAQTGWSARKIREVARALGACRIMGNRMMLTTDDVDAILEASRPCPSKSTVEAKSGIIAAPSLDGDYEALRKLRSRTEPSKSQPPPRQARGTVITMARKRS